MLWLLIACDPSASFATEVVSFEPSETVSFGHSAMPDIVLGAPEGKGDGAGSLDVVSLGEFGTVVLGFDGPIVDGPGPDFVVYENPFVGWIETGEVAVSSDGENWHSFDCDPEDPDQNYVGCAGVNPVFANSDNVIDPFDLEATGGDAFDLADLGIDEAVYIRITDSGLNDNNGAAGGFDLDAIAVLNGG
jgi:hypothetical protein